MEADKAITQEAVLKPKDELDDEGRKLIAQASHGIIGMWKEIKQQEKARREEALKERQRSKSNVKELIVARGLERAASAISDDKKKPFEGSRGSESSSNGEQRRPSKEVTERKELVSSLRSRADSYTEKYGTGGVTRENGGGKDRVRITLPGGVMEDAKVGPKESRGNVVLAQKLRAEKAVVFESPRRGKSVNEEGTQSESEPRRVCSEGQKGKDEGSDVRSASGGEGESGEGDAEEGSGNAGSQRAWAMARFQKAKELQKSKSKKDPSTLSRQPSAALEPRGAEEEETEETAAQKAARQRAWAVAQLKSKGLGGAGAETDGNMNSADRGVQGSETGEGELSGSQTGVTSLSPQQQQQQKQQRTIERQRALQIVRLLEEKLQEAARAQQERRARQTSRDSNAPLVRWKGAADRAVEGKGPLPAPSFQANEQGKQVDKSQQLEQTLQQQQDDKHKELDPVMTTSPPLSNDSVNDNTKSPTNPGHAIHSTAAVASSVAALSMMGSGTLSEESLSGQQNKPLLSPSPPPSTGFINTVPVSPLSAAEAALSSALTTSSPGALPEPSSTSILASLPDSPTDSKSSQPSRSFVETGTMGVALFDEAGGKGSGQDVSGRSRAVGGGEVYDHGALDWGSSEWEHGLGAQGVHEAEGGALVVEAGQSEAWKGFVKPERLELPSGGAGVGEKPDNDDEGLDVWEFAGDDLMEAEVMKAMAAVEEVSRKQGYSALPTLSSLFGSAMMRRMAGLGQSPMGGRSRENSVSDTVAVDIESMDPPRPMTMAERLTGGEVGGGGSRRGSGSSSSSSGTRSRSGSGSTAESPSTTPSARTWAGGFASLVPKSPGRSLQNLLGISIFEEEDDDGVLEGADGDLGVQDVMDGLMNKMSQWFAPLPSPQTGTGSNTETHYFPVIDF
eukprot:TRINITY_DN1441_c1_g1_i1.p1 TRINITY_DN1441_c1_g1~~TRINITY_DN1441_c1_g1_i1.p1  ORF type:complete len:906 (-),score=237.25 TRINITY_DN1441_c1_g1_i1:483-3200(-)